VHHWVLATMGTKPGERVMGQLGRLTEAISGDFNSQDIANTLWEFATSSYSLIFLFGSVVPCLLMIKRVFVSYTSFSSRATC
jgi:hypothetical protein